MDNDYELVYLAQEYNEDASEILYKKYKDLIYSKSRKYYSTLKKCGLELEDIIQEAYVALEEAIRCFNQDSDCNFCTFVNVCITNRLNTLTIKNNNKKNVLLNNAISLDDNLYNIVIDKTNTPLNIIVSNDDRKKLCSRISDKLSNFEDLVFELKLVGLSNNEIADIIDTEYKNVCNTVNRIKNKIIDIIG